MPVIPLVSPTSLVGAKTGLGQLPAGHARALRALECRGAVLAGAPGAAPAMTLVSGRRVDQYAAGAGVPARQRAGLEHAGGSVQEPDLLDSHPLRRCRPRTRPIFSRRVCLDLFNELPRVRDAEALQGWLIRVTTNKCYHWKRQQNPANGRVGRRRLDGICGRVADCRRRDGRARARTDGPRSDRDAAAALPRR